MNGKVSLSFQRGAARQRRWVPRQAAAQLPRCYEDPQEVLKNPTKHQNRSQHFSWSLLLKSGCMSHRRAVGGRRQDWAHRQHPQAGGTPSGWSVPPGTLQRQTPTAEAFRNQAPTKMHSGRVPMYLLDSRPREVGSQTYGEAERPHQSIHVPGPHSAADPGALARLLLVTPGDAPSPQALKGSILPNLFASCFHRAQISGTQKYFGAV